MGLLCFCMCFLFFFMFSMLFMYMALNTYNQYIMIIQTAVTFLEKRQADKNHDKFSILLHSEDTRVVCKREILENQNIKQFVEEKCFEHVKWGDNGFGEAIYQAEKLMAENKDDRFIIMFLTDGVWNDDCAKHDSSLTASQRIAKLMTEYKDMKFYAIAFGEGNHAYAETLQKMAKAGGDNPIKHATIPESLGNYFVSVVESNDDVGLLNR